MLAAVAVAEVTGRRPGIPVVLEGEVLVEVTQVLDHLAQSILAVAEAQLPLGMPVELAVPVL